MTQRNAILTAAVLTSFVLVLIGGVVARVTQASAAAGAAPTVTVPIQTTATLDPEVQALIAEREAQYQQALQDANAQLEQAYQQQQALAEQLAQQQAQAQPQSQTAATYPVSPEMAISTALTVTPGTMLIREPELVNFQGAVAYEITLDRGQVYVDANNGTVLYNGAVATASGGHDDDHDDEGHDDRDEHGDRDDHDDDD